MNEDAAKNMNASAPATSNTAGASDASTTGTAWVLAINVFGDQVGGGLGRAHTMAIAKVADGEITSWQEHPVGWDELHDQGTHGSHHARIARFMRENGVQAVVSGHMGAPMVNMMVKLGVTPVVDAAGPAREMALAAAQLLSEQSAR